MEVSMLDTTAKTETKLIEEVAMGIMQMAHRAARDIEETSGASVTAGVGTSLVSAADTVIVNFSSDIQSYGINASVAIGFQRVGDAEVHLSIQGLTGDSKKFAQYMEFVVGLNMFAVAMRNMARGCRLQDGKILVPTT